MGGHFWNILLLFVFPLNFFTGVFFFQTQMMFDFEDTERWFLRYFAAETVFVFNS